MRTIDSLIKEGTLPSPDIIKMDIQAGELAALKGAIATLPSVRALHLETWIMQAYGGKIPLLVDLMAFLRPLRFRLFDLGTQFRLPAEIPATTVSVRSASRDRGLLRHICNDAGHARQRGG